MHGTIGRYFLIGGTEGWENLLKTEFYPLHELDASWIPVTLPANLHFYQPETTDKIMSSAYLVHTKMFMSIKRVEEHLQRPGLHSVMYLKVTNESCGKVYWLRSHTFNVGTVEYDFNLIPPLYRGLKIDRATKLKTYPHKCPKCGWASYNGLISVECSRGKWCI